MNTIHSKSPCCGAKVYRFGDRRRQCSFCKSTWRIRKKKRGRKQIRVTTNIVADILVRGETIAQRSKRGKLSERQYQLRFHRALEKFNSCFSFSKFSSRQKLILIVDGLWTLSEKKKRYIVYLMVLRSINECQGIILPPVVIPGIEIRKKWEEAIMTIPQNIRKQIVALVCDGISGLPNIAKDNGWVVQRCQFHFIKVLERFRGKTNTKVQHRQMREDLYHSMRRAMIIPYGVEYDKLIAHITTSIAEPYCPKWIRFHANEFLKHRENFRTYLRYPEYQLPTTTSSMENLCGSVRDLLRRSRGFKNQQALKKWVFMFINLKRKITCNGKIQPN